MSDLVCVRPEVPADIDAIREVNRAAFGRDGEADLVDALRHNGKLVISLIAEEKGEIVGHIAFSEVKVVMEDGEFTALGLAPMAVVPGRQWRGIGSRLVVVGLGECLELGYEVVFVLGHPLFYPRFGFVPSAPLGITWETPVPEDVFMVREHPMGALKGRRRGIVRFAEEFSAV